MSAIIIGGLSYLGVPPYAEVPGGEIDIDDYGLDVLQRRVEIRPDSVSAFMFAYRKGVQDATFPWLYVVQRKITDPRGPLAMGTVVFKGSALPPSNVPVNPNSPRKEAITGGLALNQVTLYAPDVLTLSKNVSYRAPWTEWKYITNTNPGDLGPAHAGQLVVRNKVAIIESTSGGVAGSVIILPGIIQPGQTPPPPTGANFIGLLKISAAAFDYEQVGNVWTVRERNELLVVDYSTFVINGNNW